MSGDYDVVDYDHNFTADISNKMRVPHKILVTGDGNNSGTDLPLKPMPEAEMWEKVSHMHVPERIIMAGHEQHLGLKAPPRELHLESITTPQPSLIRVETPPRVLTLEDHFFPTVDDDTFENDEDSNKARHNSEHCGGKHCLDTLEEKTDVTSFEVRDHSYHSDVVRSPTEEMLALRRKLRKLSQRVALLEQEAQQRQQRDVIVLSLSVTYFLFKVVRWLHRYW